MTQDGEPQAKRVKESGDNEEKKPQEEEGNYDSELLEAAKANDFEKVKELVEKHDADTTHQEEETGASALMLAAAHGNCEMIQFLLENHAVWNAVDRQHKCAGDYAVDGAHQPAIDKLLRHGVISEMLLGRAALNATKEDKQKKMDAQGFEDNHAYLRSKLKYDNNKVEGLLLDDKEDAVMMSWETKLMEEHARLICHNKGSVLNVGHGMGIVDGKIQANNPAHHTIIEAHPDVLKRLRETGWYDKPNVTILEGRWQDVIHKAGPFDGVFYDTYAEDDADLKEFHSHLPRILKEGGIYSFYNGCCPDNLFFHGVACEVMKLELNDLGLSCEYTAMEVSVSDPEMWEKVRRRYWYRNTYYVPLCKKMEVLDCT